MFFALPEVMTMHYKGIARGKIIELEEALPYAEGRLVDVIVEPEALSFRAGSPAAIRQAMHESPRLTREGVDELEQAIASGQLPVRDDAVFDDERP
jgi:hypothetical protein